jgi:hypothetical protein
LFTWKALDRARTLRPRIAGRIDQGSRHLGKRHGRRGGRESRRAPQQGALQAEASAQRRQPGLSIVILQPSGEQQVAYQPPMPVPMLDAAPAPEAEPAIPSDADVE